MSVPRLERIAENPFLAPNLDEAWQSYAAFNPSVAKDGDCWRMLYRAQSAPRHHEGVMLSLSTIGVASGDRPFHFPCTQPFITPSEPWDRYGCEDPRVTRLGDTWFTFYTALSEYPFQASGIRVAVALSRDLKTVDEKHLVTPFNAKAMALFPEKINGKYVAILTVDTDRPPAKIALAWFDHEQQIWSETYWNEWYANLPAHIIPLLRSRNDHLEVGAQPVRTDRGWLLVHSYIRNYYNAARQFGIEAVLLDLHDPSRVIGRTAQPIMVPEKKYELVGDVANVVFPSGAWLDGETLNVYYGAADTSCCMATINVHELLDAMCANEEVRFVESRQAPGGFRRYAGNPVISPRPELHWEAQSTFNPAVLYEAGAFHILYRAMSRDGTSVMGYARSHDGVHIDERPTHPVYVPRERYEQWLREGGEMVARLSARSGESLWIPLGLLAVAGVLVSVGISVVGSIVLFHRFTLARRGEDLQRRYGLLRQRSSNLPRRRIQLLKVEEGLLRRWLRLATIRVDTASGASDEEERKSGRDVLLPIVRRDELPALLPQLLPGLEGDAAPWRQVSRRAIRRGFLKGSIALVLH